MKITNKNIYCNSGIHVQMYFNKPQYNIALTFGTRSQILKIPVKILSIICVSLISGRPHCPHAADILGHKVKRTA